MIVTAFASGRYEATARGLVWTATRSGAGWEIESIRRADDDVFVSLVRDYARNTLGVERRSLRLSETDTRRLYAAMDRFGVGAKRVRFVETDETGATVLTLPPRGLASLRERAAESRERAVLPQRPPKPRSTRPKPRETRPALVRTARCDPPAYSDTVLRG